MWILGALLAIHAQLALAQDFGSFVLQSQLTSYDNTLLDATVFVLTPPSTETFGAVSSPSSALGAPSPEPPRASNLPTLSELTASAPSATALTLFATTSVSSITHESASTAPTSPLVLPVISSTLQSISTSTSTTTSFSTSDGKETISPHSRSQATSLETLDCLSPGRLATSTSISTETRTSTLVEHLHLTLTRRVFMNVTRSSASRVELLEGAPRTSTFTTCESLAASAEQSSLQTTSSALQASTAPTTQALETPQATHALPTVSSLCGAESVVTTTVFKAPAFTAYFSTKLNGTDVIVVAAQDPEDHISPAWPFYEHPQWNALETIPPQTHDAPQRQQVPYSLALAPSGASLARRDTLQPLGSAMTELSTTRTRETVVIVTTTCSTTITTYPSTSALGVTSAVASSYTTPGTLVGSAVANPGFNGFVSSLLRSFFSQTSSADLGFTTDYAPLATTPAVSTAVTATVTATATTTVAAIATTTTTTTLSEVLSLTATLSIPTIVTATVTVTAAAPTSVQAVGTRDQSEPFAGTTSLAATPQSQAVTASVSEGTSAVVTTASSSSSPIARASKSEPSVQPDSQFTIRESSSQSAVAAVTDHNAGSSRFGFVPPSSSLSVIATTSSGPQSITSVLVPEPLSPQSLSIASLPIDTQFPTATVTPGRTASTSGEFAVTPAAPTSTGEQSATSSKVATYDCAAWPRESAVLVCHINDAQGTFALLAPLSGGSYYCAVLLAALLFI